VVDPVVIALPISLIVLIVVSLLTKPLPEDHVRFCFKK
jgi:SSS family solute:Na+ symporter